MNSKTVNFKVGKDIGITCANIAQEHLIYEFDPDKALAVFMEGFGMPKDWALKCLIGDEWIVEGADNGVNVEVRKRTIKDKYPKLNCNELAHEWFFKIDSQYDQIVECINNIICDNDETYLKISYKDLLKSNKTQEIINDYLREDISIPVERRLCMINQIKEYFKFVHNVNNVIAFMLENNLINDSQLNDITEDLTYEYITYITTSLQNKLNNWINGDVIYTNPSLDLLDRYLENNRKIDEDIENNNIKISNFEFRNAIWMSPEGEMYGLNGDIANMLHNTIADYLVEHDIIEFDKQKHVTADRCLEELGWLKIHNDWVMFDPSAKSLGIEITNWITDEQAEALSKYLKRYYNGFGKFGIRHNQISVITFKSMDKIMRNKLFNY